MNNPAAIVSRSLTTVEARNSHQHLKILVRQRRAVCGVPPAPEAPAVENRRQPCVDGEGRRRPVPPRSIAQWVISARAYQGAFPAAPSKAFVGRVLVFQDRYETSGFPLQSCLIFSVFLDRCLPWL